MQDSLKQTAVVENKPGGGGAIAYSFVAKSPADGHLLLIAPASFTMGLHLSRNPLYNPVTDFERYRVDPKEPLAVSFFVPDAYPPPPGISTVDRRRA